mmetsp:Transcript_22423/g.32303  ORF Transcript_22423/g.32303 Transcript_22423/m.32303 type:complete len:314 (-) Transcript_22423:730-1671(-)
MQGESDVGGVGDRDCSELGLLKHHEVPVWMQHAGILTGYRQPQKTLRACATTIFSLHNESINIWTHLLAAAWMLWVFFDIAWTKLHRSDIVVEFAMGAMILSAACAYLGSVAFHTFGCHNEDTYEKVHLIDQKGVLAHIITSNSGAVSVLLQKFPLCRAVVLVLSVVSYLVGRHLTKMYITRKEASKRNYLFSLYMFGTPAVLLILVGIVDVQLLVQFLQLLAPVSVINICAFTFFFSKWPESKFPGKFDFLFHSHAFWHTLIPISFTVWSYGLTSMHRSLVQNPSMLLERGATRVPSSAYLLYSVALMASFM